MKYINATIHNVTITFQLEDMQKVIALLGNMLNKENWFEGWINEENPSTAKYGFSIKFYEEYIYVDFHDLPFYYRSKEYSTYIANIVEYVREYEQFRNFNRHKTEFHSKDLPLFINLLNKLASIENDRFKDSPIFSFPKGWIDNPVKIKPASRTVPNDRKSDVDPVYQEYSMIFKEISKYNLGGSDLMVAAHNSLKRERHKHRNLHEYETKNKEPVTIHNPASFNFQLATGPNTLVTNTLKGKIRINKVVIGTKHDWALRDRERKEGGYKE